MEEKHSSYWFAQQKTAQALEAVDTRQRGKGRILIREAVLIGDSREDAGLSREAPTQATLLETLRMLHPSRRKNERRKRNGKRK
jgi:hypothetical protein